MNDQGNERRVWFTRIGITSIVVVVLLVGTGVLFRGLHPDTSAPGKTSDGTRFPAPDNVVVPDPGMKGLKNNIAMPQVVVPLSNLRNADFRQFSIHASNNAFSPDTIIVRVNDLAEITVFADDRDYDFTQPDYGIRETIPKGTSKRISFTPSAEGRFVFYCSVCGTTPSSRAQGSIIVSKR